MEDAALDALRNESFVGGESISKFEEEFARYTGTKFAVSVSSGNSALQISLMALGISDNSKVITPTNSFIASANCIRMNHSQPILADINISDGSIDINSVSEKADAIIPVHIYGNPCNFDLVQEKAEEQIYLVYLHILLMELLTRKKLLKNHLASFLFQKMKNLFKKFYGEFIGRGG